MKIVRNARGLGTHPRRIVESQPCNSYTPKMPDPHVAMPSGVPTDTQYAGVVDSELFSALEEFSDSFLENHPNVQESYGWVRDPLHQWSRQWEYPFVMQSIISGVQRQSGSEIRVLDAGSGVTFFPYLLQSSMPNVTVTCCDYDASLANIFNTVNDAGGPGSPVEFRQADMRQLPFDDASFDVIYCVSVLEHTDSYADIVKEFHRLLLPGGLFVTTFDIGLDGVSDIPPAEALQLAKCIEESFDAIDLPPDSGVVISESVSSRKIGAENPELLPWRYPFLSWLKAVVKRRRVPHGIGKNLSVFCAGYRKARLQDGRRPQSR